MHFALDGVPEFAAPYELLNDPAMQSNIGIFSTPEELQQQWEDCRRGIVPADPSIALQIPSVNDPGLAPPGKHAASAFSLWFPVEESQSSYGDMKVEMGRRVIEKITRLAPNFESLIIRHTTFTPKHMGTMFGAPGGDYCHGLIHPDQMGPNRPGPKGYIDQPIPIDGLYLASAGCHGGPGITFIPGYNAAKQALADAWKLVLGSRSVGRGAALVGPVDTLLGALGRVALDVVVRACGADVGFFGVGLVLLHHRLIPKTSRADAEAAPIQSLGTRSAGPGADCSLGWHSGAASSGPS